MWQGPPSPGPRQVNLGRWDTGGGRWQPKGSRLCPSSCHVSSLPLGLSSASPHRCPPRKPSLPGVQPAPSCSCPPLPLTCTAPPTPALLPWAEGKEQRREEESRRERLPGTGSSGVRDTDPPCRVYRGQSTCPVQSMDRTVGLLYYCSGFLVGTQRILKGEQK